MSYCLTEISPAFLKRVDHLREHIRKETLYKNMLERALDSLQGDEEYLDNIINTLIESQRILMIHDAGLATNQEFYDYYMSAELHGWHKHKSPPVDFDLIEKLADKVYNMRHGENDYGMLQIGDDVRSVIEVIFKRLISAEEDFDVVFTDPVFKGHLFNHTNEDGIKALATRYLDLWKPVTRRIVVASGLPAEDPPEIIEGKDQLYQKLISSIHDKIMNSEIHYTLTVIPTPRDAEFDKIPYEDYLTTFFEMCDQPWEQIEAAQDHLIKALDKGKHLRFTNNDGTDIEMSIDGMTFANSVIARNVPGAEVFSAPLKESANGKIVAKGTFTPSGSKGKRIEDITLIIKNGKIIDFDAQVGKEHLAAEINKDSGSCYLGEIGIGTNPHLKNHVSNGLLVEKIGGSFHVALGQAYTATEYMSKPVNFDNGNRSLIHWDITTMLYGKDGKIYLDGELIMDNGIFLDSALDVINRGWESIPVKERPEYWQKYNFSARKY